MEYEQDAPSSKIIYVSLAVSLVLFAGVFWAFSSAKKRTGTIVLPGGITYLGPTPTKQIPVNGSQFTGGKIPISGDVKWAEQKGKRYPYSFSFPSSISLGVFPDDPYDSVTVFYQDTEANNNIFFRVEDLNKLNKKEYIGKPMEYAQNWWKDYTWKGVSSVTAFTNSSNLKGYRARYLNEKNETPYDHVFFEVVAGGPGRTDLIIWISGKLFSQEIFDRLVDSVTWTNN